MSVETSILIPTYNNGKYLLECIGSILRQEYTNYEIVIIDDHSDDNTFDLLMLLSKFDTRIKYYKNKKRSKGIVSALNYGITLCKGKYIARMDADDLMIGNRLNEQIDFLKNNSDISAVCSGMQLINKYGLPLKQSLGNPDIEKSRLLHLFLNMYTHATMTASRKVFVDYKYKKDFIYCEDYELWSRIIQKHRIKHIQNIHHIYRIYDKHSSNSISNRKGIEAILTIFSNQLDFYKIAHSEKELIIHYGLFYEKNQIGSKDEIKNWLNKIFTSQKIIEKFHKNTINDVRNQIFNKFNIT